MLKQYLLEHAVVVQGNATVVGSIPTSRNELLFIDILISSLWHQGKSSVLNFATQHAIPLKFGGKCGTESVLTLGQKEPIVKALCQAEAYPGMCGIQGDADLIIINIF